MGKIKLFKGHDGCLLTFDEYKQHAKIISHTNIYHSCTTFLFCKHYRKNGIRVIPPRKAMFGKTKEEALENAYQGYVSIYNFINK